MDKKSFFIGLAAGFSTAVLICIGLNQFYIRDPKPSGKKVVRHSELDSLLKLPSVYVDTVYADGTTYKGFMKGGRRFGSGTFVTLKGSVYMGNWENNQLPEGSFTTENCQYTGKLDKSLHPSGYGVMDYNDGSSYCGFWQGSNKHGLGKMVDKDHNIQFGIWENGVLTKKKDAAFHVGDKVYGIDVSFYQNKIDWNSLYLYAQSDGVVPKEKNWHCDYVQPVSFAFIRSSFGSGSLDETFEKNCAGAERCRIPYGAYHFFIAREDLKTQLENYAKQLEGKAMAFGPIIDIESRGDIKEIGVDSTRVRAKRFLDMVEKHFHTTPIIYSNENYKTEYLYGQDFEKYDVWVANYNPKVGFNSWKFWQYSDKGKVNGINGPVDLNVFNGNYRQFLDYLSTQQPKKK